MISEVETATPTYIASDGMFAGSNWMWIIVLFLIFGFGGNGFGNGNYATTAELQTGLYNQTTDRNLSDIKEGICGLNQNVLTTGFGTEKEVLQNRYDNALGQCGLQKDILLGNQSLQSVMSANALTQSAQMAECCCTLRQEASANTQRILDAITNNRISDLEYQLNQANTAVANAVQTQNILNSLGDYYPRMGINPYSTYNCCGC